MRGRIRSRSGSRSGYSRSRSRYTTLSPRRCEGGAALSALKTLSLAADVGAFERSAQVSPWPPRCLRIINLILHPVSGQGQRLRCALVPRCSSNERLGEAPVGELPEAITRLLVQALLIRIGVEGSDPQHSHEHTDASPLQGDVSAEGPFRDKLLRSGVLSTMIKAALSAAVGAVGHAVEEEEAQVNPHRPTATDSTPGVPQDRTTDLWRIKRDPGCHSPCLYVPDRQTFPFCDGRCPS